MTDREKVIKELCKLHGTSETMTLIAETIVLLKEQPEIVRCQNCKHIQGSRGTEYPKYFCCIHREFHEQNWFCADGERKDDDA